MAVYEYKALADTGKSVKGIIDADSPVSARRKLREQNLYPTQLSEGTGHSAAKRKDTDVQLGGVSSRDVAMATRQMAVLLRAGMPLMETLTALIEQTTKSKLRNALYEVRDRVTEGQHFADGLAQHPRIFSSLYVNMVRAGESSGSLELVLFRLADLLEHQARMKAKVFSTLAYPAFMVLFAIAIISFLTLVVVPKITTLFEMRDITLPRITKILIGTTDFIGAYWYLLIGGVIALFALWRLWVGTDRGRITWDRIRLRMPILGPLLLKLVCARFARILSTMLVSGMTMMRALEIVNTVIQNKYIEGVLDDVKSEVRRGRGLAGPLKSSGEFPPMLIHMVELGQRSGEIEDMLQQVADTYDEDVQVTIDAVVSLLEPIIIIVMGVFVGLLVLSILMPILQMSTNIG
jgi:general secretion pathway protein F